ncbi:TetR/AcrR family transcriptional regulator [Cohnella faecalis]|uniref:TetR/AcrR family transcriptional regulator n=1 Tax=Cohnella faecalis TaxID=2315694 RepID=A0A398CY67_9BACL|nr:TetR/AcrR family transcriptional regulator [Cohnella faecalis]RIE04737.1 TetR/AcrR family transcriptional regulator [Cohnella faecalis]
MSPRNADRDRLLREERREQLREAALEVIARRGLSAAKVADIASSAGVSVGYVYKYFESKEQLFMELVEEGQLRYREFVAEVRARSGSALERMRWYTQQWLGKKEWAITILLQYARTSEAVPEHFKLEVSRRFLDNLKPLADIIKDGQSEGTFVAGDALELALLYVSLMEGLTLHNLPGVQEINAGTPDKALGLLLLREHDPS